MKVIRVLWGNNKRVLNEIPKSPLFEDEEVFVFGTSNRDYLQSLGYRCRLLSSSETLEKYSSFLVHFAHKLEALKLAEILYREYLFLDWDISLNKEIDDNFYKLIRQGENIQCPVYSYSNTFYSEIKKYHISSGSWTSDLHIFLKTQDKYLQECSWEYLSNRVLPCFCFFYSRDSKVISKLLSLYNTKRLKTCIEEFSLYLFVECGIEDYIKKYEPIVIRGKEDTQTLKSIGKSAKIINSYVDTFVQKDIYLLHDIL